MEAATQDRSTSGTWRPGFLHLAPQKVRLLDHEEARGDVSRESAGAEAGLGAMAWLPLKFSQRRWGARLGPGTLRPRLLWKGCSSTQEITRPKWPHSAAFSCT